MGTTTVRRTSFCITKETQRQLEDLCRVFGENNSQVITRALQMLHYSLRFPNITLTENVNSKDGVLEDGNDAI